MRARGRTGRRLAAASLLALALLAAGVVLPGQAGTAAGSGGGGWGQPVAPDAAFGYFPPSGGLGSGGEVPARLLGVVGYKPAVVARLDPRTLRPLPGPRVRLPFAVSGHAWSPDRSRLVVGDLDDDALHVLDPVRLRRVATIRFGIVAEAPQQLAWLGPRRLAVVAGNPWDGATLVMADPVAGRVLSRRPLNPAGIVAAQAGDRLVLLHSEIDRIGPARLSVVDERGRIDTVQLSGVRAGFQNPPDWDRPGAYAITRDAGLAVDPAGGRAFVVAAGPTVAEVDLASLRVTYRQLRQPVPLLRRLAHWLVPRAEAKQVAGSWRSACWLGGGTLAVSGGDSSVTGGTPQTQRMDQRPSGLKLVDTRTWTLRTLDPAAPNAGWQGGRLLVYGRTWDDQGQLERGVGVTVHGPGRPRHVLGTRAVDDAYLNGDLVYASVDTGDELFGRVVVSLRSGRVVASSDQPLPYLLLDDPRRSC